jgi:uncharacterized membrane protein YfcA
MLGINDAKSAMLVALALFTLFYLYSVGMAVRKRHMTEQSGGKIAPTPIGLGIGFITNFFDTLGIGSFATTTSMFRFLGLVRDEQIPGTLNVGHTLPTIAQAFIYTRIVPVESTTLIAMIAASVLGAWLGAGVVSSWPRRRIQWGMGVCLLGAAVLLAAKAMGKMPSADVGAVGVTGAKLGAAVAGNFLLGALMTLGIGLYAPCMILIALLGMNPTAAFPIMMGSCAFLMPISSARFVKTGSFDLKAALALAIGGVPAVLIAAFIVKSLPLTAVMWLVVVVVVYTGITMIMAARREAALAGQRAPQGAVAS